MKKILLLLLVLSFPAFAGISAPPATSLGGATFAAPGAIGSTTPGTVAATDVTASTVITTGVIDGLVTVVISTAETVAVESPEKLNVYTFNNETTGTAAITYTLPTAAAGKQRCYKELPGKTGTLRINTSAAGQTIELDGANSASGGYIISGGALGDSICMVGVSSTSWIIMGTHGTWTLN